MVPGGLPQPPVGHRDPGQRRHARRRPPAPLDAWFSRRTTGLAEPMAEEFRLWYQVLRDGSTTPPRARARSAGTIRQQIACAAPFLHTWTAAGRLSLREITRDDITSALAADATRQRHALFALRSLFRTLKGRCLIFTNPTMRLRGTPPVCGQPLPLDLGVVRKAPHSGKPDRAALAALVAFYAPRSRQITSLQLTDIRDGRLHLPDRTILLAGPVREKLADWLTERARRWPATVNPHLFINWYTAVRTCPATHSWVSRTIGASAQAIREDRILHEAQASHGDIRRLCDLFGLTPAAPNAIPARQDHYRTGSPRRRPDPLRHGRSPERAHCMGDRRPVLVHHAGPDQRAGSPAVGGQAGHRQMGRGRVAGHRRGGCGRIPGEQVLGRLPGPPP